jgi:hypothetical protein
MPKYSVIGGNKNHYKNNNEKVIRLSDPIPPNKNSNKGDK